jgi:hypothetical protein
MTADFPCKNRMFSVFPSEVLMNYGGQVETVSSFQREIK